MLGNRPRLILLFASGMLAVHLPEIAHDSEIYQRYIGKKQHKQVPVEHLPYHPVHQHHGHHNAPHHVNATVEGEVRNVVRHMEHVKNRSHEEVQGEIVDVVAERNRQRHAAEEVARVIREDGIRQKEVEEEIEMVAKKEARKHGSLHSLHNHHHHQGHHETGSGHMSHNGVHSHHQKDYPVHALNDRDSSHHQSHTKHGKHSKSHAMPMQRRPYPSHHGFALEKREDVDENVVYVFVTDYVTETIIPKVTKTRHITSTIFVEAATTPESETVDETSSAAEDMPPATLTVDHTLTVTVTDTVLLEATPETLSNAIEAIPIAVNQSETAEQNDSITAQGRTQGSPTSATVEEREAVHSTTDTIDTNALVTVTATVLETVTLTMTLEETVTQTVYHIAEPFEEDDGFKDEEELDEVEYSTDSSQSTTKLPSTTSIGSEYTDATDSAVAETTSLVVTDEALPAPTESSTRKVTNTHDTETASDSAEDTKEVVTDVEELIKGFDQRPSSSVNGNPVRDAVADVESQLKAFKPSLASQKKPSNNLTLEQQFRQACKFPYGSDAFWDCHHRFFGKPLVKTLHHHTRHGKHAKHHMMKATKGVESAAPLEARLRKFRHRR